MPTEKQILAGRKAVDAYRKVHLLLHQKPYYRQVHNDHTPLLIKLVDALDKLGFTSTETDFEPKKTEILAKFFDASEELNILEAEGNTELLEGMWH